MSGVAWLTDKQMNEASDLLAMPFDELMEIVKHRKNVINKIYMEKDVLKGVAVIQLFSDKYRIKVCAGNVAPIIESLKSKSKDTHRNIIDMYVEDSELKMHLYLKSLGFVCDKIKKDRDKVYYRFTFFVTHKQYKDNGRN